MTDMRVFTGTGYKEIGQFDLNRCCASVKTGSGLHACWYQCKHPSKLREPDRNGVKRGWCARHAPSAEAAKDAKLRAKWAAEVKAREQDALVAKLERKLLAAVEVWRDAPRTGTSTADRSLENAVDALRKARGDQ